jgi:beta-galactosidase
MKNALFIFLCLCATVSANAQRTETLLKDNWKFNGKTVSIPHDWAITGPFSREYDLQNVRITQNNEQKASVKTGRTGGLPYVGKGEYTRTFDVAGYDSTRQSVTLLFDGAMSEAHVSVNGKEAIFWPYGYNSFYCDVTKLMNADGKGNLLDVKLENRAESSRWYPGAGLYRNVHLIVTNKTHIPVWGTYITTPHVATDFASVRIKTDVTGIDGGKLAIENHVYDPSGKEILVKTTKECGPEGQPVAQNFSIDNPQLWSPEHPYIYKVKTLLLKDGNMVDSCTNTFGIRSIEFIAEKGFFLNGQHRQIHGVCNHHDLGPLGAAVNTAALRHQLTLLKDMGCDAIRTSHNMPAPELVQLCDEMGFMMMIEPFDEWDIAKCKNGYHRYFNDWAEKDMVNMIHHYRNHPSVVMWSIGNEVPSQGSKQGYKTARFLQDICHREDPTRPVTCGMDQVSSVLSNGFAAQLDIPGFNYRVNRYEEAYSKLPQSVVLGSETCSTVSSRGVYKFPATLKADATYPDHQSSSYDLEYCSWSNVPDEDFAMADAHPWNLGQFVWTGFDYLGEPSPYDTDAWPNHSSMFGIIDLASIPKDRYYLYRSIWNTRDHTLHILPHWTWNGREGQTTPVFVYTDYPAVELFINGKSQGKRSKRADGTKQERYRMMWNETKYEPGELKAVAYDKEGNIAATEVIKTAGKPDHLMLSADRTSLSADGEDLAYITVSMADKDGNVCPMDSSLVTFKVSGAGHFRASANGNPCSLDPFQNPKMHLFSGKLTAIVQSGYKKGGITFTASGKGVRSATLKLDVQ